MHGHGERFDTNHSRSAVACINTSTLEVFAKNSSSTTTGFAGSDSYSREATL